jgi:hypothetical protein
VVRFDGLAGLEDHQDGKMDTSTRSSSSPRSRFDTGPVAIAHTTCVWTFRRRKPRAARAARCVCVADLAHVWQLRRHPVRGAR